MHRLEFNARVVDGLTSEALVLMNEARHAFAAFPSGDAALQALVAAQEEAAIERMMQALTWLRDQQDHLEGRLSLFRLRLRRLPRVAEVAPADLALLPEPLRELAETIAGFYQRLQNIEAEWRSRERTPGGALAQLRRAGRNGAAS